MAEKYFIDLKEIEEGHREEECDAFISALCGLIKGSELIDFSEYNVDEARRDLFNYATDIVSESLSGCSCKVSSTFSQGGFVGTISIVGKHIVPSNNLLFKSAVLSSDSLEMEARIDGSVTVNLTFFDMLKKVSDWSKN